jgi:class 3 adenylate cyclase
MANEIANSAPAAASNSTLSSAALQLRLLLEELCCELCRFQHVRAGLSPEAIRIDREFPLGAPGAFADIRIEAPDDKPYFVEVKHGYPDALLVSHMARKYAAESPGTQSAGAIILLVDLQGRTNWAATKLAIERAIRPGLRLEVWDEAEYLNRLRECFSVEEVQALSPEDLLDVRHAIDEAKGFHAFGGAREDYEHDPLKSELLWHFGFWHLRELREKRGLAPREILPPGHYKNVSVVLGDLCGFSSYVRDTPDPAIARDCLTAFYSKARYQIINCGGMLYQFVGDEVVGLFGLHCDAATAARQALDAARGLLSIGNSVSHQWQRHLDRVQPSGGLHVGVSSGELQIVSLRPFSRTHMGALGDCINVAARLMSTAGPGEIVATNNFHRQLDDAERAKFTEIEPVELKNVGRLRGWKTGLRN